MHPFSLNESPTSLKLQQEISNSQITKEYLEKKSNKYLEYLDELLEESDPKRQYEKLVANRMKEKRQLEEENRKLLQRNKFLEEQLKKATREIKRLGNERLQQSSPQHQHHRQRMQEQSPQSPSNNNSSQSSSSSSNQNPSITPLQQQHQLQQIDSLTLAAQQLATTQQQAIQKSTRLLQRVFDSLERMFQLQKITAKINEIDQQDREMVLVSREKYLMLVGSFVKGIEVKSNQDGNQQAINSNVKQFSTNGVAYNGHRQQQILTNSTELQHLFSHLAQRCGLSRQWQTYLQHRKTQAQQFKLQIDTITKGSNEQKQKLQKNITMINDSTIASHSGKLDVLEALKTVESCQKQIQQQLFEKLHKIISKIQFKQQQKQLFNRFDQKRKCGRLFSLEEFIQKFKSKQDLYEISKQYTNYMVRTINMLVIKMMQILTQRETDILDPEKHEYPWLIRKLDAKSTEVKKNVMDALEKQFSAYLEQKHPLKQDPLKGRKIIKRIVEPVFDKEKELEKELIKVVIEYRDLLQSCVVNSNRRMMVRMQ